MFCPLPRLEPRDSHLLWLASRDERSRDAAPSSSNNAPHGNRRSSNPPGYHSQNTASNHDIDHRSSFLALDSLSSIVLEERTLQVRKNNIATFGATWIRPTGCSKTMLALREEEAEREEMEPSGIAGATDDVVMTAADATHGIIGTDVSEWNPDMMRNLDDDIPEASNVESSELGLVESGEGGFDDGLDGEEEELMERDLDDDVPEGNIYSGEEGIEDDDEEEEEEEEEDEEDEEEQTEAEGDHQALPENHDDNDENEEMRADSAMLERNLDDDIPDGDESSVVYNPYTEDGLMDQGLSMSLPGSNAPEPERDWANSDNEDLPQSIFNLDSNLSSFVGRDEQKYEDNADDTSMDVDSYTQNLLQSSTSTLPPMMTPSLRAPRTNRRPIYPSRNFHRIMSPVGPIPFLQPSGHQDSETERLYSRRWSGAVPASGIGSGAADNLESDPRHVDVPAEPSREPHGRQANDDSPESPSLSNVNMRERRTQRPNQDMSAPRMRTRRQAALGR